MRFTMLLMLLGLLTLTSTAPAQDKPPAKEIEKIMTLQREIAEAFRVKKYEEAVEKSNELIKLRPKDPTAFYNLACAQARLGKTDDAFDSLGKSIEHGYGEPNHMKKDEDFEKIREDKRFTELLAKAKDNEKKRYDSYKIDKGIELKDIKTVENKPEEGLRYRLRMSEKATAEKPNKLIIWLHPSGGSMNDVVEKMAPDLIEKGFALLVLTQKQYIGWTADEAEKLMQHTLPEVAKVEGIDAKKPMLLGFSAGGQMALDLWQKSPDKFGGLILDAAYSVERKDGKFVAKPPPKDEAVKKTPVYVIVGENDGGAQLWKDAEDEWQKAGVPLTIRFVPNKGHVWLFDQKEKESLRKWLQKIADGMKPSDL